MEKKEERSERETPDSLERWRYEHNPNTLICKYWIKRKQRQCTHRVADGNEMEGYCTEHSFEGLKELRKIAYETRILYECQETISNIIEQITGEIIEKKRKRERKSRVSAPKRMANPFR